MDELQFERAEFQQAPPVPVPEGPVNVTRGALFAAGAAVLCSFAYAAIIIISNYELALISIAVGWLVGTAARRGAGNQGSRPLQYVAVACTYAAIAGSLFFQVIYAYFQEGKVVASWSGYLQLGVLSLGKPFYELSEGLGGILGIAILFFGLQQAWQQTGLKQN
jgi:hypothetical protein